MHKGRTHRVFYWIYSTGLQLDLVFPDRECLFSSPPFGVDNIYGQDGVYHKITLGTAGPSPLQGFDDLGPIYYPVGVRYKRL